jgi:hypothetical protein
VDVIATDYHCFDADLALKTWRHQARTGIFFESVRIGCGARQEERRYVHPARILCGTFAMLSLLLLALTPLPPELDRPPEWLAELTFDGEFEVVVLLATDPKGEVKRVMVRTSKRRVEIPIETWQRGLQEELKKARTDVKNPDSLRVVADKGWCWRHARDVTRAGQGAGFQEIGFTPWPKR